MRTSKKEVRKLQTIAKNLTKTLAKELEYYEKQLERISRQKEKTKKGSRKFWRLTDKSWKAYKKVVFTRGLIKDLHNVIRAAELYLNE